MNSFSCMFLKDFVYIVALTHNFKEHLCMGSYFSNNLFFIIKPSANIYLLKINKRNTRTRCEIYLEVKIKSSEQHH